MEGKDLRSFENFVSLTGFFTLQPKTYKSIVFYTSVQVLTRLTGTMAGLVNQGNAVFPEQTTCGIRLFCRSGSYRRCRSSGREGSQGARLARIGEVGAQRLGVLRDAAGITKIPKIEAPEKYGKKKSEQSDQDEI